MNLQKMMKQAQEMQAKFSDMQSRMEAMEVDGTAADGKVLVRLTGGNQMLKVHIDPSLLNPEDKELIEDLFLAAYRSAREKLDATYADETQKLTGGMNLPPGMKLPF
jgi:hypothetical protein